MARPSGASDEEEEAGVLAVVVGVPFVVEGSGAAVGRGGRGRDDLAGEAAGGGRVGAGVGAGVAGAVTISDVGCSSTTVELDGPDADSDI